MPRAKADNVVIHRIELGGKEREFVEGALAAFQFNRVATPIVAGMSDVSFMVVFASLMTLFFPNIVIPTGVSSVEEVVTAILDGLGTSPEGWSYEAGPISGPTSLVEWIFKQIGIPFYEG